MSCQHMNFHVQANVGRLQRSEEDKTIVGFTMDVTVKCTDCDKPFEFIGLPMGYSPNQPMCSVDGIEARMPIKPVGESMAVGLPEFTVRMVEQ